MPKSMLVVQNSSLEGPGAFESVLRACGVEYRLVDLQKGEAFPPPVDYGSVLVMGGPASAYDDTPVMHAELDRIHEALDADIPYLGVCLGMQCLVKAAGGSVRRMKEPEIGFRDVDDAPFTIELTADGKDDPLLRGCPQTLPVFHLHGDAAELGEDMRLLGAGRRCTNQIIRVGSRAYGIQGHFDLNENLLRAWLNAVPELQNVTQQTILDDWARLQPEYARLGETIMRNFLMIAGYIPLDA